MSRTPHSACFAARFAREIPAPRARWRALRVSLRERFPRSAPCGPSGSRFALRQPDAYGAGESRSAHFEAAVGLGGASRRAPLDLPVLIPRVKNGLNRGTRAALCERQPLQMPINAVAPPLACPSGRLTARGYSRGGCVCALCRPSAVVPATRGESRRLRRRKKSAAVSVLTSSPEICRAFLARAKCPKSTILWL